jgi:hypothetical protein
MPYPMKKKEKQMKKVKQYYVDFSCMVVNAESYNHAEKLALQFLQENKRSPCISSVEECTEEDNGFINKEEVGIVGEETFFVTEGETNG